MSRRGFLAALGVGATVMAVPSLVLPEKEIVVCEGTYSIPAYINDGATSSLDAFNEFVQSTGPTYLISPQALIDDAVRSAYLMPRFMERSIA